MINAWWLLLIVPGSMAVGAVCVICASLMVNSGRISKKEEQQRQIEDDRAACGLIEED